jgi:hypothetical protein
LIYNKYHKLISTFITIILLLLVTLPVKEVEATTQIVISGKFTFVDRYSSSRRVGATHHLATQKVAYNYHPLIGNTSDLIISTQP